VLADNKCNSLKQDRLPACDHLAAWSERNAQFGDQIATALEQRGVIAQLDASRRVTEWAYAQTEAVAGLTWLKADKLVPLRPDWRTLLAAD